MSKAADNDGTQTTSLAGLGGKTSPRQITGADAGNSAVKTIQALATEIQVDKLQAGMAGKDVLSFTSTSVATTSGGTAQSAGTPDYDRDTGVTDLASIAQATATTTAGAVDALRADVDGQIAEIRKRQGGHLTTKFEREFDNGPSNTLIVGGNGTATNTTVGKTNSGIELAAAQTALYAYTDNVSFAQKFAAADPTAAKGSATDGKATKTGGGPAILLTVTADNLGGFDGPVETRQQIMDANRKYYDGVGAQVNEALAAFQKGALASQNGKPPANEDKGAGFSWTKHFDGQDFFDGNLTITATIIPNYDAARVAAKDYRPNSLLQKILGGGTMVGGFYQGACNWSTSSIIPLNLA